MASFISVFPKYVIYMGKSLASSGKKLAGQLNGGGDVVCAAHVLGSRKITFTIANEHYLILCFVR